MFAENLRTEYLERPVGLGNPKPEFSWTCQDGLRQTAYEILVKRNGKIIWDTGKRMSSSMTHIVYDGKRLYSRDRLTWSVKLWDENDREGAAAGSSFEMGLLKPEDWKASWITGGYKPKKEYRYPADCFRKTVKIEKEVRLARIYASARGVYDIHINGKRIEDFILAPGITDYRKHIQYQTYDVTGYLQKENEIILRLADGWYRGSSAAYGVTQVYGNQTSALLQLEITYKDGSRKIVGTDKEWDWSNDGPIRYADLKDGEVYNASKKPSFAGKAQVIAGPKKAKLIASDNVYVSEHERFSPKLFMAEDGSKVLDFGQNIAGYLEFTVRGKKNESFRIVCGELVDEEGHVDLSHIQETVPVKRYDQLAMIKKLMFGKISGEPDKTPKQEILFTCSGEEDHYKSSFCVFGFRYAQIIGDIEITPEDFTAIAVYSNVKQTGFFDCSNPLLTRVYQNTIWSVKGNFLDIPTDCPTRERLGWSGDGQIFFNTGTYMTDSAAFYRKWIRDMQDAQYKNGIVPAVFPYEGMDMMYRGTAQSVGWADAVYLLPYRYYLKYGDRKLLEECFPMMEKYAEFLKKNLGMKDKKEAKANPYNEYTYEKGMHLGEWLEAAEFQETISATSQPKHPEEATAYLYLTMTTMIRICEILGKNDRIPEYTRYADGAKQAYEYLFVRTGKLDTDRQAKLVRPLALGLLEGEDREYAQKRLVQAVKSRDYCVGTGFLSTVFLPDVLTEAGEAETAYKLMENTKKPGWIAEILEGATTIWENWDGEGGSANHYSPGAACQWLMETAAGIRSAGENHFVIAPVPGGSLTYAKGSYDSFYGKVSSSWTRENGKTIYSVTIPSNCTAQIRLPGREIETLGAGQYTFEI